MTNYEELLLEYKEQRTALKKMVADLDNLKVGIEKLFPERLDARNLRFLEEKVKAITDLFKAILDIRKELSKIVKDEIELRRKLEEKGGDEESTENIADLARKVEALNFNIKENAKGLYKDTIFKLDSTSKLS